MTEKTIANYLSGCSLLGYKLPSETAEWIPEAQVNNPVKDCLDYLVHEERRLTGLAFGHEVALGLERAVNLDLTSVLENAHSEYPVAPVVTEVFLGRSGFFSKARRYGGKYAVFATARRHIGGLVPDVILRKPHKNVVKRELHKDQVQTSFEPSESLAEFIIRALIERRELAKSIHSARPDLLSDEGDISGFLEAFESDVPHTIQEAKRQIKIIIKRVLSTIGRGLQSAKISQYNLSQNGEFNIDACHAILDRLPVRTYDAPQFLYQLYKELVPVAASNEYCAAWGCLSLCNGELCLKVNTEKNKSKVEWKKAKSL